MYADSPYGDFNRAMREDRLTRAWQGRSRGELVRAWGEPGLMLKSPGFNEHRDAVILVFFGRDPVGGCIDAFVVWGDDEDEPVATYICR